MFTADYAGQIGLIKMDEKIKQAENLNYKLSNREVEDLARKLIKDVILSIELPDFVQLCDGGGDTVLMLDIDSEQGSASINYRPQRAAESVIREAEARVVTSPKPITSEQYKVAVESFAVVVIERILKYAPYELEEAVVMQPNIAKMLLHYTLSKQYPKEALKANVLELNGILLRLSQERRSRFIEAEKNLKKMNKPDHLILAIIYQRLLPIWRDAKKRYKLNKDSESWQAIVKVACPYNVLPDDLIAKLDSLDSYESQPATLAYEHSARLCGCNPYEYEKKTLQDYRKEGGEKLKELSSDKVNEHIAVFFDSLYRSTATEHHLSTLFPDVSSQESNERLRAFQILFPEAQDCLKTIISNMCDALEIPVDLVWNGQTKP